MRAKLAAGARQNDVGGLGRNIEGRGGSFHRGAVKVDEVKQRGVAWRQCRDHGVDAEPNGIVITVRGSRGGGAPGGFAGGGGFEGANVVDEGAAEDGAEPEREIGFAVRLAGFAEGIGEGVAKDLVGAGGVADPGREKVAEAGKMGV